MPSHFIYDKLDSSTLCQGDVLQRTDDLLQCLREYHRYYAEHSSYRYFIVLTQSCDLIRTAKRNPASAYITLSAVRPLSDALELEAKKHLDNWQIESRLIGEKARSKLAMFLERLLDNNEPDYFYLHMDPSLGIHDRSCAFLRLPVSLRIEHYDRCVSAKIAQLTEPFQAKLGWLLGHLYGRVGTSEWNDHYKDNQVATETSAVLKKAYVIVDQKQIDEGLGELRGRNEFATKSAVEIKEYILQTKVIPKKEKFRRRALDVISRLNVVDLIRGRGETALRSDIELRDTVDAILVAAGIPDEGRTALRDKLVNAVLGRVAAVISDAGLPGKDDVLEKVLAGLLQDPTVSTILK